MMTDLPWITDRLPTARDADPDGLVVSTPPGGGLFSLALWCYVSKGVPWLPYSPPPLHPRQQPRKVPRKIVQAIYAPCGDLTALADDGTLWILDSGIWGEIALPDREEVP